MKGDPTTPTHVPRRIDGPVTMPSDSSGWWERERASFVRSRLVDLTDRGALIVDVGCGRGDMLDTNALSERRCVNVDSHLWSEWVGQDTRMFVVAEADALPFRDGAFDLVGSFDVLEHLPDDCAALREQRRIAAQRASIVAAMPADRRLWSAHDEAVGHHRRYGGDELAELARSVGLDVTWSSYFYSFLWLPAYVLRNSPARRSQQSAKTSLLGRVAEKVIGTLAGLERLAMGRRWRLPFGSSMWAEMRSDTTS